MPVDTQVVFSKPAAHSCDLLAVCVREGALAAGKVSDAHLHDLDRALGGLVRTCAEQEEFTGKEGQQLVLHARRELPVVHALAEAAGKIRVVAQDRQRAAEVLVRHRAALTIGERTREVTIRHVIAVGVVP